MTHQYLKYNLSFKKGRSDLLRPNVLYMSGERASIPEVVALTKAQVLALKPSLEAFKEYTLGLCRTNGVAISADLHTTFGRPGKGTLSRPHWALEDRGLSILIKPRFKCGVCGVLAWSVKHHQRTRRCGLNMAYNIARDNHQYNCFDPELFEVVSKAGLPTQVIVVEKVYLIPDGIRRIITLWRCSPLKKSMSMVEFVGMSLHREEVHSEEPPREPTSPA
jgi:hypothetical protein